jgi:hypothetical protein
MRLGIFENLEELLIKSRHDLIQVDKWYSLRWTYLHTESLAHIFRFPVYEVVRLFLPPTNNPEKIAEKRKSGR